MFRGFERKAVTMQPFFSRLQRLSIQTQLVVYYTTFAVITVGMVMFFAYNQAAQSLQTTVEDKLETVAQLKKNSLGQWMKQQQRNAIFLSNLPELRSLSGMFFNSGWSLEEHIVAHRELRDLLNVIVQRTTNFRDIQLLGLNGQVAVSTIPALVGTSQKEEAFFQKGRSRTFTQTFYHSDLFDAAVLTIATPVLDDHQKQIGVLVFHLNMRQVDAIIHEDPQLIRASVQTYLVDPSHRLITEDPGLAQERFLFSPGIDSALKGGGGSSSYVNHNGAQVIGKYTWMDEQRVALIVEMEREVALQPARELALKIGGAGFLVSLLLLLAAIIIAQRITAPLRALSETVSHISQGQLDAFAPIFFEDEVGSLARAFNSMTEKLRQTLAKTQEELRERKYAETALHEREERIRALLHAFPDMLLELSLDGKVISMVPPKGSEISMPADYFIGRQIHEIFKEVTASQTEFAIWRASDSGQMHVFEFESEMGGFLVPWRPA
jgi:nitrogen fixation/metabolism regulation signal transduction histidine kinase